MTKLFIADKDFEREIPRTRAYGYKSMAVAEDVEIATPFKFQTEGVCLMAVPDMSEDEGGDGECYTILCKEFGLVGGNQGFKSKMSVMFCDNGIMAVTLYHGGLVVNLDGQLMMPTVGDDVVAPKVVQDNILWVDADKLLGYSKYLNDKGNFMYDYEFMLELSGDNAKGMGSFIFRHIEAETIDISLGYVAYAEQQKVKKEEAREAQNTMKFLQQSWGSHTMEFDDEPEQDETEGDDNDDDSGVEWL